MDPAELSAFAKRLFEVIYGEAKDDPDINFPHAFEHGERLGRSSADVIAAVEQLREEGLVRWKTNVWVELTHAGLREGKRRFGDA